MNLKSLAVLIYITSMTGAFARIGETEKEIIARYGKSITNVQTDKIPGTHRAYAFNGYLISVTFADGVSVIEMFVKGDKSEITTTEAAVFLSANKGSQLWKPTAKKTRMDWIEMESADGELCAVYSLGEHALLIAKASFFRPSADSRLKGF